MKEVTLLYDAECVLCTNSVRTLRKLKTSVPLRMISLQEADLEVLLPGTSFAELQAQIHVIDTDGQVYKGADSIICILKTVPSLKWISWLYRIPGLKPMADLMYRWVAKNRYKLFGKVDSCDSGACELHRPGKEDQEKS
jgi:predicted DCC family thiol-disulfide oxidoreductase YuxK